MVSDTHVPANGDSSGAINPGAIRPAPGPEAVNVANAQAGPKDAPVRLVRLSVSRIEPMSAMKVGFLVSFAMGLIMIIGAGLIWFVLDAMEVFSAIENFVAAVGAGSMAGLLDLLHFSRVLALVAVFAVIQVVIMSILSWLAAVIYNLIAFLVGGVHVVLSDE